MLKRAQRRGEKRQQVEGEVEASDISGEQSSGGEVDDEDEQQQEIVAKTVMLCDPRPSVDGDEPGAGDGGDEWGALNAEQQLSAAGPAPAAADGQREPSLSGVEIGGVANPRGYDWERVAFAPWSHGRSVTI